VAQQAIGMMFPKGVYVRDKNYLRRVAAEPCIICQIEGYSQAAHVPTDGKAMKQSDRETFPLCCVRPGVNGCHQDYDQYRMFPDSQETRRMGRKWAEETRDRLDCGNERKYG
jgi:hypothetical protein